MAHTWYCSITFYFCSLGIIECFSGTMDKTRQTNSMACSLPCFKSLWFLSLGGIQSLLFMFQKSVMSKNCNRYRMELRWFRHQQVTQSLFRCEMSCAEAKNVCFEHFLQSPGGHNSEIMLQKVDVHVIFFLKCRFTFCTLGCAFFVHPVYYEYIWFA